MFEQIIAVHLYSTNKSLLFIAWACFCNETIRVVMWSNTNQPVMSLKKARSLKFQILEGEGLYYPCSENKGADQLCSYCTADLRLYFRIGNVRFSHDAAHNNLPLIVLNGHGMAGLVIIMQGKQLLP